MRTTPLALGAALAALVLALASAPAGADAPPNSKCLRCHSDAEETTEFEDGASMSLYVDEALFAASVHGQAGTACADCHADVKLGAHPERELVNRREYALAQSARCESCHKDVALDIADDIHRRSGKGAVACIDCHNPHEMTAAGTSRTSISLACGKCHAETVTEYRESAHGSALFKNANTDVPVCTDCHAVHRIAEARSVDFRLHSVDLCKRCHGDEKLMAPYGLSIRVLDTYLADFHGVSVGYRVQEGAGGEPAVARHGALEATCIDCHGAHAIARRESPQSLANSGNLTQVCGRCHEGATASFTKAWLSHYIPSPRRAPLVFGVRVAYTVLIPVMIGGLLLQVAIDLLHIRRQRRERRSGGATHKAAVPSAHPPVSYRRFGPMRRMEHLLAMVTFTLLILTGLPQKFNDAAWAGGLVAFLGGLDQVRILHRVAGIVFAVQASLHVLLNLVWLVRGRIGPDMLLGRQDFRDAHQSLQHALGLAPEEPKQDRYDYRQKFEYWGMLFGGAVMVATGFLLYFPIFFTRFLPGELIPAAKAAHGFEAVMALLVILVWHLYCVVLRPGMFPVDRSIFTGRISHERMVEEHPLELERLARRGGAGFGTAPPAGAGGA